MAAKIRPVYKLITSETLITGIGNQPIRNGAVLFKDDHIINSGPKKTVIPQNAENIERVDYGNSTILPGLIDTHVHLIGVGDGRVGDNLATLPDEILTLQASENARAHLISGVTTVRDCGSKNMTTLMLRKAYGLHINNGPNLGLSGRPAAIIGGHLNYFGIEATGIDECRAAVRQLFKDGADFVKITASGGSTRTSLPLRPSFTIAELKAIIGEAHNFGKHAAAHCVNSQSILNCLEAGIDTIIHGRYVEPNGSRIYRDDITERIVKQKVFVNYNMGGINHRTQPLQVKKDKRIITQSEQLELDGLLFWTDIDYQFYSRMRSDGVQMVCGSDSTWGHYKMGQFSYEIEGHVAAGMSPMEAITAATIDAAKSLMQENRLGSLEPGNQADILVVKGDASSNIENLRNVIHIYQSGLQIDTANN